MQTVIKKSGSKDGPPGRDPSQILTVESGTLSEEKKEGSLNLLIRGAISLILMSLIIWKVDVRSLLDKFIGLNLHLYVTAFLLVLVVQMISARSWLFLLKVKECELKFTELVRVMLMGAFFGTFLPSSAGSDVVNSIFISRMIRGGKIDSMGSLLTVRVTGIFVLLLFSLFGSLALPWETEGRKIFLLAFFLIAAIVSGFIVIRARHLKDLLERLTSSFGGSRLIGFFNRCFTSITEYWKETPTMAIVLLLSVVIQIVRILSVYVIALSIGIEASLYYFVVFIPLISIILMVPISIGGIGVREGGFVFLFSQIGVESGDALSMSLLAFSMHLLLALMGGASYLVTGIQQKGERR